MHILVITFHHWLLTRVCCWMSASRMDLKELKMGYNAVSYLSFLPPSSPPLLTLSSWYLNLVWKHKFFFCCHFKWKEKYRPCCTALLAILLIFLVLNTQTQTQHIVPEFLFLFFYYYGFKYEILKRLALWNRYGIKS